MSAEIRRPSPFANIKYSGGVLALVFAFPPLVTFCGGNASAQETSDDLSQKLANLFASLISVPIPNNFDFGAGAEGDGFADTLNIQPVISFELNETWNLITRTIIPVGYRDYLPGSDVNGLGTSMPASSLRPRIRDLVE